ncbi:MAG: hypothetical protein IJI14_14060 [Anaerolineaceae bacterium]|nr:hypothetical protein [Anaerolineaceae bacterium]
MKTNLNQKEEDVEFTGWANGGAALGRLADGRVVFTNDVLPGEKARVRYADREARFISAELVRLLTKSPMRIEPRCPLYGKCVHCCLQNLEYPDQLHAKREILLDHLTRIAGLPDAESLLQPVIPSPAEWNYARSLILGLDGNGNFCVPDRNGGWLKLEAYCPVTADCLNDVLASLAFEGESGIGEAELRADDEDGIQVILRGDTDKPEDEMENDTEISVVYQGPETSWVMAGVSTLQQTAAGVKVCASDSSPFIKNPAIFTPLCEKLLSVLPDMRDISLLHINCGTGFWSHWFGTRCREVNALMADETQCEDFVYNLDELDNVSLYIGDVKEILPPLPKPQREWVLLEGSVYGFHEEAVREICSRDPEKIIVLYEDPAILARDLKRFTENGRTVQMILPYDPAPQAAAIGAAALL